jgi:hypothetical protein
MKLLPRLPHTRFSTVLAAQYTSPRIVSVKSGSLRSFPAFLAGVRLMFEVCTAPL